MLKMIYCVHCQYMWCPNYVRFARVALFPTVSEISAIFWGGEKKKFKFWFLKKFEMLKNVLLWTSTTSVITNFCPLRSIPNHCWGMCKFMFFKIFEISKIYWNFWNVQKCFDVIIAKPCDRKISSVSLYLLRFLSFKF